MHDKNIDHENFLKFEELQCDFFIVFHAKLGTINNHRTGLCDISY